MELSMRLKVWRVVDVVSRFVIGICFAAVVGGSVGYLSYAWSSENVSDIKGHAAEAIKGAGFTPVGYTGYTSGSLSAPGGRVWYTVERGGVTYELFVAKWRDEYHIYRITPLTPAIIAK